MGVANKIKSELEKKALFGGGLCSDIEKILLSSIPFDFKVRDIIKNLKNKPGLTVNLNAKRLKSVREEILYPVTNLKNGCIDEWIIPDSLIVTSVLPVIKIKNKTDFNNLDLSQYYQLL